jgi:hypothetical protein
MTYYIYKEVLILKIAYKFYSLKDFSDLSIGERFLEILLSAELLIDKADDKEPIKKEFVIGNISEFWKGLGIKGESSTCYFLFKGTKK